MNQEEFIKKAVGVEWVNRGIDYDGMDCHGLNYLYYRDVLGVDISLPDGYFDLKPIDECWRDEIDSGKWVDETGPVKGGIIFTCYKGSRPMHVGVCISKTHAMHCLGGEEFAGSVSIHSIAALKRTFGKMTFHSYRGCNGES